MLKQLIDTSIKTAIAQDWPKAIEINQEILDKSPDHIPTLNRLANAYYAVGNQQKATELYQKVLKLDKYNSIAQKNLKRLEMRPNSTSHNKKLDLNFIEEPGRTKTTSLVRLADQSTLASLNSGEVVSLRPKNRLICVYTNEGVHLGVLADDIAYHMRQFVDAGYHYTATIKSVTQQTVTIFIKETKRTDKLDNQPTFTD